MIKEIYLAGGCFWGVEAYFKEIEGVVDTEVGYANGKTEQTTYEEVPVTDHAETVHIKYDDEVISLEKLLEYLYYIIDPFSIDKQGNDRGRQYRTGIYSINVEDLEKAREFLDKKQVGEDKEIQVEVEELKNFIIAEDYHQDYLDKNPTGYCHINLNDRPSL
ncbi:peptide-methionine (S)-S-oxide reductase MsrA [Anaerococcus cruorum]|uniref:peptide-methionine (S)-S-oxide reductase MsrA n=1 Tax=Anaerococcus sp. WGS1529 TaxID=3366812 RepID=UPI00372D825E